MNATDNRQSQTLINIVGLGVAETAELSVQAEEAFNRADIVLGSKRQLKTVHHLLAEQQTSTLPKLSQLPNWLALNQGKTIAVLASGDPLFYGIGQWFSRHYLSASAIDGATANKAMSLRFYPAVSSIQATCHLLGLALQNTDVVSLHGRPLSSLRSVLKNNCYCLVLTDQNSQPVDLAKECLRAGFDKSLLWVCENIGYSNQQVRQFNVEELIGGNFEFDPLHVSVIKSGGIGGVLPEFPGIPDEHFITNADHSRMPGKGMISKREVRLSILSLIQPKALDVIWDIGAGCGGVSVELALWNKRGKVHAIEKNEQRLLCLNANRERFGVELNLDIHTGTALQVIASLPDPSAVFIGGSDGELAQLLTDSWMRLSPGGCLVASAVTENTKQQLLEFSNRVATVSVESTQILVSRAEPLAGQCVYRPALPVTLFKLCKVQECLS